MVFVSGATGSIGVVGGRKGDGLMGVVVTEGEKVLGMEGGWVNELVLRGVEAVTWQAARRIAVNNRGKNEFRIAEYLYRKPTLFYSQRNVFAEMIIPSTSIPTSTPTSSRCVPQGSPNHRPLSRLTT